MNKQFIRRQWDALNSLTIFFMFSNLILIFLAGRMITAISAYLENFGLHAELSHTLMRWGLFIANAVLFIGILRIHQNKLNQECSLRKESEEHVRRLERMFHSSREGMMITDADTTIVDYNPAFLRMTGYNAEDLKGQTPRMFQSGLQDQAFYEALWSSLVQKGAWKGEIWNRRKDGTLYPEWVIMNAITDDQGQVTHYAATFSDMTERLKHENMLRMHAQVFASSHEGIMITDTQGQILSVNPMFTETTGYTAEEVIGQTPKILQSGRQDAAFYEKLWSSIRENGEWQGEIWNKRKNGDIYPEWLTIREVRQEAVTNIYIGVFSDITERKMAEENLNYMANYDFLTGLPNRRQFQHLLKQTLEDAKENGNLAGVLFIDLDRFKVINDTLGHDFGDKLLAQVGKRLLQCVDSHYTISRLGGDEFTVIMPKLAAREDASRLCETILKELAQPFYIQGRELHITGSVGVSMYPEDGTDLDTLVKHADSAMYEAKEQRNDYRHFLASKNAKLPRTLAIENGLRTAVSKGELEVFYQPQRDCRTGVLTGLEALLRWHHSELGMVSPAEFIPIAEEIGLIADMDEWVLEQACRQNAFWRDTLGHTVRIAVNLSAKQLHRPGLIERIRQVLDRYGLMPSDLEVEITESVSIKDSQATSELLSALRQFGITTAIDDFGTGHSALAYLKQFEFRILKIDQSFIRGIDTDPKQKMLVKTMIDMSHALGLEVVAEGVETIEELEILRQLDCDKVQGYIFGRPQPAAKANSFLNRETQIV